MRSDMITIGIPAYNEERYISRALDCVLGQTFGNLRIIVSDNGSTDRTGEICEGYARDHENVEYVRHETNMGVAKNWNFVASGVKTKYFKWHAANDVIHETMVEKCISVLEEREDVVLVYPKARLIDERGSVVAEYKDTLHILDADPVERFRRLCLGMGLNNAQCGVIRTAALDRTGLVGMVVGGDIPLMAELILYGKFYEYPEYLFSRRVSKDASTIGMDRRSLARVFDPNGGVRGGRSWDYYRSFAQRVCRSDLPVSGKLSLYQFIVKMMWWDGALRPRKKGDTH